MAFDVLGESWEDRLAEAAYTPPSGERIKLIYEDVSVSFDKKASAFEFAGSNDTYVQDRGSTSDHFPMRVFFTGHNYDEDAQKFLNALRETGVGVLEHPAYGTFDVVPFGTIRRLDNLKTRANQAVFEVEFWETTRLLFPVALASPGETALIAIDEGFGFSSTVFDDTVVVDTVIEETSFGEHFKELLAKVTTALLEVAAFTAEIYAEFVAIFDSINAAIDALIQLPLTLASQTQAAMKLPARAAASITTRMNGYKNLLDSVLSGGTYLPSFGNDSRNAFASDELIANGSILSAATAAVDATYLTRNEALETADFLLGMFDDYNTWRDLNFQSLNIVDTGESYQALSYAVSLVAGFLVQISFSLQQERSLTLDRARTPIDLTAELYGSFGERDSLLYFFIETNQLLGTELFEIQKGREVVYYV